jgi:hypothetical protein
MNQQFSFFTDDAVGARDAALARVSDNAGPWMTYARAAIVAHLPDGWRGTAEDCRVALLRAGVEPPHHHNAWGALIKSCIPLILRPTGEWRNMRTEKSHARSTPVYRRV